MIIMNTNYGPIKIKLDAQNTPDTVENFLYYVNNHFYDNTIFHRVIDQFMIQGGGFDPEMQQKEVQIAPVKNEAAQAKSNKRGTVAMARLPDPHSATNQFFINVQDNDFLDHQAKTASGWGYCVFGEVVEGMDVVDEIKQVKTTSHRNHQDVPIHPVIIETVFLEEVSQQVD